VGKKKIAHEGFSNAAPDAPVVEKEAVVRARELDKTMLFVPMAVIDRTARWKCQGLRKA